MLIWTPLTEGNNTPLRCLFREIEHIKLQSISLWFTPSDPFLHENRELCKYHKATVTVANAEQHCSATSRKKTCSSHVHSTLSVRSCHDPDTTQWFPYSSSVVLAEGQNQWPGLRAIIQDQGLVHSSCTSPLLMIHQDADTLDCFWNGKSIPLSMSCFSCQGWRTCYSQIFSYSLCPWLFLHPHNSLCLWSREK